MSQNEHIVLFTCSAFGYDGKTYEKSFEPVKEKFDLDVTPSAFDNLIGALILFIPTAFIAWFVWWYFDLL